MKDNASFSSGQFGWGPLPGEIFIIYFCHGIRLHVNEGVSEVFVYDDRQIKRQP
jgi:hypothetical protein